MTDPTAPVPGNAPDTGRAPADPTTGPTTGPEDPRPDVATPTPEDPRADDVPFPAEPSVDPSLDADEDADEGLRLDDDGNLIDPPVLPEFERRLADAANLADVDEMQDVQSEYEDARRERARKLARRQRERDAA